MKLFKKDQDDILYKLGYSDAERKVISEWKQKCADIENEKDEIIEQKEFEIKTLQIQLKNWKADYDQVQQDKILIRKEKSEIKKQYYKINKFKDEIQDMLSIKLNEDAGKVQEILSLLNEHEFKQIEN